MTPTKTFKDHTKRLVSLAFTNEKRPIDVATIKRLFPTFNPKNLNDWYVVCLECIQLKNQSSVK